MKVKFRTFESGFGDCCFIVFSDENAGSYHLMVDCYVLTDEIKSFIRNELGKRIDTIIVTHIDRDHANGITRLMQTPDFADLKIGQILFNGFQPQKIDPIKLPEDTRAKLDAVAQLLPPSLNEKSQKTNGMDAACLINELNKHPQWKSVWHKTPILAGDIIPLGENAKWGNLKFLSPTLDSLNVLFHDVKLEYARRLSEAPPDEDFEDQDKYFELMLRLAEHRMPPYSTRKTGSGIIVTKDLLERFAKTDADEISVTNANKASLAFYWEGGEKISRILMMGDAVSSQVLMELNSLGDDELWFEVIKVSHHGSKNNTSIGLNERVNSAHYFITGGKEGQGPHIETLAKIAVKPLASGYKRRELHYNHSKGISIWGELEKDCFKDLLNDYNLQLTTENTYEFES